jgi:hypothetical protein
MGPHYSLVSVQRPEYHECLLVCLHTCNDREQVRKRSVDWRSGLFRDKDSGRLLVILLELQ